MFVINVFNRKSAGIWKFKQFLRQALVKPIFYILTLGSEESSLIATHNFLISFIENYVLSIISCVTLIQD